MGLFDDDQTIEAETVVDDVADDDIDDVVDGDDEPIAEVAVAIDDGADESAGEIRTLDQAVTAYFSWEEQREAKRSKRKTAARKTSSRRTQFVLDEPARQAINRFLSHVGPDTPLVELSPNGVERFQQVIGDRTPNLDEKLRPVKELLRYCWRQGYCDQNLGNHLKVKRIGSGANSSGTFTHEAAETFEMTAAGLRQLEEELALAEERMPEVIQEVAAAREDKDIRENAPLEAAREEQERLRSRMDELEYRIARAVVREALDTGRAQIGSVVSVVEIDAGGTEHQLTREYTLVGTSEAKASEQKISVDSPLGRGLLDQRAGNVIEFDAPSGRKRFRLLSVATGSS